MYEKVLIKAKQEKANISQSVGNLILFKTPQITDKIRKRWLFGKDPNGDIIGTYKSSNYRSFKVVANSKAEGLVDLTLTGRLGNALTVRKKGSLGYEVFSTDSKYSNISEKYGLEQFNLSEEEQTELFDEIYLTVIEDYLQNVWLA